MAHDDQVRKFAEAARRYCEFVDTAATFSRSGRLHCARQLLAELVHAACDLPRGDAEGPDANAEVPTPSSWPGFGDHDVYWEIFDPYEEEPPVCGSLSDDLLDIYSDLRRGLAAYDAGDVGSAVWEWRFHFDHHWGDHAVDALRALQRACARVGNVAE